MNKTELIAAVAEQTGVKKKDTEAVIKATFDTIQNELTKKNGKVQLVGFGTFEVRERAARIGRNPQKPGETMTIPASKAPAFKAGKPFKDFINK